MSFSLFDLLLIIIVSQGIFLSIVLQFIPNTNKNANSILSIILLIAAVVCFGRVLVFKYSSMFVIRVGTIVDGTIFMFGPLLYLYFRRLILQEENTYKLSFKHYIILCLFAFYTFWTFTLNQEGLRANYINGILPKLFFTIELTGILSMVFYTFRLTILLKKYKKYEHIQIAYNQGIVNYIKRIIIAISIFVSIWIISFTGSYFFGYNHPVINYNTMWLSTALFMYFIGFYSLAQPEIFRIPIKLVSKKTPKNRMQDDDILNLKKTLDIAMNTEQVYLKADLSLVILAEYVKTSSNNLSWYLNTIENKTFYKFINEYRINAFLKKIQNNEHETKTLIAIAFEVGFNTKSTFNKSFKSIHNDTPVNYIKKLKNKSDWAHLVD